MAQKNDMKWQKNYKCLRQYIIEHHHLPNKRVVENRGLLNWWKYNRKLVKQGKLAPERMELLQELSDMRSDD